MNKAKIVAVATLVVLLSNFLVYQYALASNGANHIVSPFGFVKGHSVTVLEWSNTLYAINGTTGVEVSSGTDASTVIQAGIDALTGGGKLVLKAGTYSLSNGLVVSVNSLIIEGEGMFVTILSYTGTGTAVKFDTTAGPPMYGSGIRDLTISKADNVGIGLEFSFVWHSFIENLRIYNFSVGIRFNGTDGLVSLNRIEGCRLWGQSNSGILFDGTHSSTVNMLTNVRVSHGVGTCVLFNLSMASECYLGACVAETNAAGTGIVINGSRNQIIGGLIEGCATGINFTASSVANTIFETTITGNSVSVVNDGTDNRIINRKGKGFVTENSGSANNSTATTFVFDHGLAGTATGVWASFNTTAITGWSWTSTSTQTTITVAGESLPEAMKVHWQAEYKP